MRDAAASEKHGKWVCSSCGRKFPRTPPDICPGCGVLGAFSEMEAPAPEPEPEGDLPSLAERTPGYTVTRTGYAPVDQLMGGFLVGTATTIYGGAGGGKSTLGLRIAAGLAKTLACPALLVVPEMSREILGLVAARSGVPLERLIPAPDLETWHRDAGRAGARVVLFDSVSRFPRPVETLHQAIAWARERPGIALCLAHRSRGGAVLGGVALEHDPDCVLRLTLARGRRTLAIEKCRWASVGSARL